MTILWHKEKEGKKGREEKEKDKKQKGVVGGELSGGGEESGHCLVWICLLILFYFINSFLSLTDNHYFFCYMNIFIFLFHTPCLSSILSS